ncbi:MAG TPA: hypothetical protein VII13_12610 [Vicinamibacteria bacterium]|jgi:hypothetical protein
MARGFDSKSVSEQQEEVLRAREGKTPAGPPVSARRRSLELARVDLLRRMAAAPEAHREALRRALADLDDLIAKA